MPPEKEQSEIMKCLGMIMGKVDSMEKAQSRVTYALIGVIAAQIGVKIIGSDPLLDIATALAFLGCVLILGCMITGLQLVKAKRRELTSTGLWLLIVMGFIILTQIAVYFRELGLLSTKAVYIIRIFQNGAIIMLGWNILHSVLLFKPKKDAPPKDDTNGQNC